MALLTEKTRGNDMTEQDVNIPVNAHLHSWQVVLLLNIQVRDYLRSGRRASNVDNRKTILNW